MSRPKAVADKGENPARARFIFWLEKEWEVMRLMDVCD